MSISFTLFIVGVVMLASMPLHSLNDLSVIRVRLNNGQVENMLPPVFHGNPISADGSLVFTDFGWDLLATIRKAGFADVAVDVYASHLLGHLGGGLLLFRAEKFN